MYSRLYAGLLLAFVVFSIGSCESGDREEPGDIDDLCFFWDADALTVDDGEIIILEQYLPAETRSFALTATGDNDDEGEASFYDLRYFTESDYEKYEFDDDWDEADKVAGETFPSEAGDLDVIRLYRLDLAESYYFALLVKDEVGQHSDLSNIVGPVKIPLIETPLLSRDGADITNPAAVASIGDFNDDEYPDVSVGNPDKGRVLVYYGMSGGDFLDDFEVEDAKVYRALESWLPDLVIEGDSAESFGAALAGEGRIRGEEQMDLVAGAPDAEAQAGKIYLFAGDDDYGESLSSDAAFSVISGDSAGDRFGSTLAPCDDLNGDGCDDFAVSSGGAGKVYVILGGNEDTGRGPLPESALASGAAALVISEGAGGDELGASLACGLDINGDQVADLVIGAPGVGGRGAVYVFFGGDAGTAKFDSELSGPGTRKMIDLSSESADVTILGTVDGARFGQVVEFAGDLLGRGSSDTTRDLAVSATGADPGKVYVFYGGSSGNVIFPSAVITPVESQDENRDVLLSGQAGQGFGSSIGGGWDLNDDDYSDLAISMPDVGEVIIYFWDSSASPDSMKKYIIIHPSTGSGFGTILETVRDFNNDDKPDLFISAPNEGKVYLEF